MDAHLLAEAYDMGMAHAEDDVKDYGEKRWRDSPYLSWMNEEETDSYWAGYEAYEEDLVMRSSVDAFDTEILADGRVIVTGTIPPNIVGLVNGNSVTAFSVNYGVGNKEKENN